MVYFKSSNIISSLGFGTEDNFQSIYDGNIGISKIENQDIYHEPFLASMINENILEEKFSVLAKNYTKFDYFTKLEKMIIMSVHYAIMTTNIDISSLRTAIVISTTKGNIDILSSSYSNKIEKERAFLWSLGRVVSKFFGNPNDAIVVSNACVSGVVALNTASSYIKSGKYDNVVVTGGDIVSRFVVSGFMSFLSLSPVPCKPFDKQRCGLSLGEASGTIILSNIPIASTTNFIFSGGSSANDANHISGPSRDGEGSFIAIKKAITEANVKSMQIDHISAHGTATPYNDEMESKAIYRHGMNNAIVNSIKGVIGHTLGAAGIVETAILLEEMKQNVILKSLGYFEHGVSKPIKIANKIIDKDLVCCLKMASGFGGSNAALVISKINL